MLLQSQSRQAATLLEFAVVASATMLLLIGIVVGGMGIYRYNLVATLAREASRQASVHGTQFAKENGQSAWTATDVYNNVISPETQNAGIDSKKLTYSVTWNTSNSPYRTQIVNNQLVAVNNTVTVTINYQWIPEAFFSGGVNLTSTSVAPMTY